MGKKTGVLCIALGICLLASSVGLILYNRWEDRHAESESLRILQDVQLQIPNKDSTLPEVCFLSVGISQYVRHLLSL